MCNEAEELYQALFTVYIKTLIKCFFLNDHTITPEMNEYFRVLAFIYHNALLKRKRK